LRADAQRAALTTIDAYLPDDIAGTHDPALLKRIKTPIEQLARLLHTLLLAGQPAQRREEPPASARSGNRDGIAETLGIADAKPVNTGIQPDERVAVALEDSVPLESLLGEIVVMLRIAAPQVNGQLRHLARGHLLPVGRKPSGVGEGGLAEAEAARPFRHHPREAFLGTGDTFRKSNAGVVRVLNDDPLHDRIEWNRRVHFREHGRGAGGSSSRAPGVLADEECIAERQAPLF